MITCQCAEAMPTYAPQSSYLTPIPSANIERGVAPLDSLPADWWNWLWNNITLNEGRIVQFINSVFSEINSVLSAAGVTPSTASTTDLRDAIQKLATTVATAAVPGSVLSSTLSGKLRVIADGTASINGLGTPDQLETTSKEVVSAINEVLALAQGKAPTSHASSDTTYGVGTTQQYGHVKVTEGCGLAISSGTISLNAPGYNCTGTVTQICYNGAAYSPSDGVVDLGNAPSGFPGYGTAICPLNGNMCCASSAGTSDLVARADHVHQMPNCISNGCSIVDVSPNAICIWTGATAATLCKGVANTSDSTISVSMRGRRAYSGTPSNFCMSPSSDGNAMTVMMQNCNAKCVRQAYLPQTGIYTWEQFQSCLGIGTNCPFSGGYTRYLGCTGALLGGYFDSHGNVHFNVLTLADGCIYNTVRSYSDTAYIQGVITWVP